MAQPALADLPAEMIRAVQHSAAADADRVGAFLNALGLERGSKSQPLTVPLHVLLDLAAALRLLDWESHGLADRLDAGLPSGVEAVHAALRALVVPAPTSAEEQSLAMTVYLIGVDRFAWHGAVEWGSDILIDFPDEEAALDALAEFAWQHRHIHNLQAGDKP